MTNYNSFPLGKDHIPKYMERHELHEIAQYYKFNDPREVVTIFENEVAAFSGSKYAVAVDCCTHAIELSFRHLLAKAKISSFDTVKIPKHTYVSVYQTLRRLVDVELADIEWSGVYKLGQVTDGAARWSRGMYEGGLHCLSFQKKKVIPIGRGGMVLTDDKAAADWIRLASYDGRDLTTAYDTPEHVKMFGYHYYMTPEDAAYGLLLMKHVTFQGDSMNWTNYPDLTQWAK